MICVLPPMIKNYVESIPVLYRMHAVIKASIQERKAARSLARYRRIAAKRGIVCSQGDDLCTAVRARLATRCAPAPKPKGELHVFLAYYISNWEAILPKALDPFGPVTAWNLRGFGFDDRRSDWIEQRDRMNEAMLQAFFEANRLRPVDAVVGYLSGYNTSPETLRRMAVAGAAIFNFCWDDKLSFPGPVTGGRYSSPAAIASAVDLNLTNAPDSVVKYAVHGGLAMFWPEAAHPEIHRPHDVPFQYDVSFVGACYGWRPRFIKRLERLGVHTECFGKGWPNGPLSAEEMVQLYSRSRINLGFGGVGHSRKLTCLKGRDFEVPMSGGLYLTQHNPELALVYDIGKEIMTYRDEADCAVMIKHLLADPSRAALIREAARARALRDHTYEVRWTQVFRLAGLMAEDPSGHS
jgi:spore maturation protein CgeB